MNATLVVWLVLSILIMLVALIVLLNYIKDILLVQMEYKDNAYVMKDIMNKIWRKYVNHVIFHALPAKMTDQMDVFLVT